MNRSIFLIFIIVFISACNSKDDIIIQNVKLFDGDRVIDNATIIINDNVVEKIITNEESSNKGETVVDGNGFTIIPGLINAHVHAFERQHSEEAVKAGVLTLLDLFNNKPVGADSLRNLGTSFSNYAYYFSAGPTVTVPGGHGSQFGPVPLISNTAEVAGFIEDRIAEGSDYIKLIIERGSTSYPMPTLTDEMIRLAMDKVHEKGIISVAHISRRADAIKAAELGVDGLAHIWRRDLSGITEKELMILKDNNVFIIPTLLVRQQASEKSSHINMQLITNDLLRVHKAGIPVLAGTDPPNLGINYGTDLFRELELLVELGFSDLEALKSATSTTSKAFNLGNKGFIKEGFSADFVLIKGDPTTNIGDIYNIEGIWKQGKRITPYNNR